MVKKVILCILVIFVAWLLAVLLHNWGVDFYKKYYSFKRDLSFGIIIHFVFLYYFPVTLVGCTLLFFSSQYKLSMCVGREKLVINSYLSGKNIF